MYSKMVRSSEGSVPGRDSVKEWVSSGLRKSQVLEECDSHSKSKLLWKSKASSPQPSWRWPLSFMYSAARRFSLVTALLCQSVDKYRRQSACDKKALFWLLVLRTSVHDWLVLLLWGGAEAANWDGAKPPTSWPTIRSEEEDRLRPHDPFPGHIPSGLTAPHSGLPPEGPTPSIVLRLRSKHQHKDTYQSHNTYLGLPGFQNQNNLSYL